MPSLARRMAPADQLFGPVLVVGFARTGQSVAAVLGRRGVAVIAIDDAPSPGLAARAAALGVELHAPPGPDELAGLCAASQLIVVSPGVPPSHPVFRLGGPKVVAEIELAFLCSTVPVVAVTGTNGKTTVTSLVAAMLTESGVAARPVGNIGDAFINAVDDEDLEVAVCEVSSFQLEHCRTFAPAVGCWLNLAEDHLDWHPTLEHYIAAKARLWAAQGPGDVAVANADDAVVIGEAKRARGRLVTFARADADYRLSDGFFVGPAGERFGRVSAMPRAFPHDLENALGAVATAHQAGATPDACAAVLARTGPLPHRVARVGSHDGVDYYDDSKATTPSAVRAALAGFEAVVLIAGGRNKGLDLSAMVAGLGPRPLIRGVVAIGEAAEDVAAVFTARAEVLRASSMDEAVAAAASLARAGDAVLLSPGCASFDWYRNYEERGEDFARAVAALDARAGGGA